MKREIIALCMLCVTLTNCRKFVEVNTPENTFEAAKVYLKDAAAISVLTSIYQEMSGDGVFQGSNGISSIVGLSADELIDYPGYSTLRTAVYQNQITSLDVPFWSRLYYLIYTTNTAIQGISTSNTLSYSVKQQLLGEAKFIRAFLYFYLVNLWGNIPLIVTSDYRISSVSGKSSENKIYEQITLDLLNAQELLSEDYLLSNLTTVSSERIRPNKWTAKALLSRVYLYNKEYERAEILATEIINHRSLFEIVPNEKVFLDNSKETIWQIQAISPNWNTYEARSFILTEAPNFYQSVSINRRLIDAFEPGDKRRKNWIGSISSSGIMYYFPFKYKVNTENASKTEALIVFRLAEQYLIRAESRAELNKIKEAVKDINEVRGRSRMLATTLIPNPLPDLPASITKEKLFDAIMHERQIEFFTEWGHRWLDLKRTNRITNIMSSVTPEKGGEWKEYKSLYPIPQGDLIYNPNIEQNPNY